MKTPAVMLAFVEQETQCFPKLMLLEG